MVKEFNSLEEIQKYYDKNTNTYVFKENGEYIGVVVFNFNLNVDANIDVADIDACDISALNIDAWDIKASNINALNISYWGVCFAYDSIKCKSIKGRHPDSKHFAIDGELVVEEDD